jgi:uncharacterized membrane protein YfcA
MKLLLLVVASFLAGAVNSVAGGGTMLTFPSLLAAGVSSVTANATNAVALVPGSLSAFWGYRSAAPVRPRDLVAFGVPSVLGGIAGALLVMVAGERLFSPMVPWLLLGATGLFLVQDPIRRWMDRRTGGALREEAGRDAAPREQAGPSATAIFSQFLVGVYGGFFGAGIGILMLAAMGLMGLRDIHAMNRLKNFAAACINGVAAVTFVIGGKVHWPFALLMAVGSLLGGYLGAGAARRIGPANVRRIVVGVGLSIGTYMLVKQL